MGKNKNRDGNASGMVGGMKVENMVRNVENQMAAGMHVSAKASSPAEEESLKDTREKNNRSAKNAKK